MEKHYWFANELCWKVYSEGCWNPHPPPRPTWAENQNDVPPLSFIELWVQAASLNDVKKHIFWRSLDELRAQHAELSQWLEKQGYEPLPDRQLREDALLNPQELQELEDKGLITKMVEQSASSHQKEESFDPLNQHRHIQISEGGGMRFSARH